MPTQACREKFGDVVNCMFATVAEKIGGLIAGAAMVFPAFHSYLKEASETAAMLLPICGVMFFAVQFWAKTLEIRERNRRLADGEEHED